MQTIIEKIEKIQDNLEVLYLKAKRYGFTNKRGENIRDFLNTREYFAYLCNTSKRRGMKEIQKNYYKFMIKIINQRFREEIVAYRYCNMEKDVIKKIIGRMNIFKENLTNELKENLLIK